MNESFKNIEQIELYLEGKLSDKESLLFKNRLLIDEDLKQEFELYKLTIAAVKENSNFTLKNELDSLDKELDKTLILKTEDNTKKKHFSIKKLIGIAASLLIIASLSFYLIRTSENEKLFQQYYFKDKGLPVTMSINNSSLNSIMNSYKLGNTKKALQLINKLAINDTTIFYKAVFLLELEKNNEANNYFNKVPNNSVFKQKAEFYYALSLLEKDKKEECRKALQVIVNTKDHKYSNQANKLLSEKYFQE